MRIGLVSDNHRLIDPALPDVLRGVDEIWHAGDLVTPDILPALRALAPVLAVRGNNDVGPAFAALPEELHFEREGVPVLLRHIVGRPERLDRAARRSIEAHRPRLVVMGHSHRPLAQEHEGTIFLNPGSCGPRRFSLSRTAATLDLTRGEARVVIADLDSREVLLERSFRL